jgi:hypothetical protein
MHISFILLWTTLTFQNSNILNLTKFWLENVKENNHLVNLSVSGSLILKWILEKYGV